MGEPRQTLDLDRRLDIKPDLTEIGATQAGQHSDRNQLGRGRRFIHRLARRLHHLEAAQGMDIGHPDAEIGGSTAGLGDGIGYVMKLQVEKDLEPKRGQLFDQRRTGTDEQLLADLELALVWGEPFDQGQGSAGIGEVEGDDDPRIVIHFLSSPARCHPRPRRPGIARRTGEP